MSKSLPAIPKIEKGVYEHYKGKRYEVIDVALHSESLELLVIYKPLYKSDSKYWVRPYKMFFEDVSVDGKYVPRFKKLK